MSYVGTDVRMKDWVPLMKLLGSTWPVVKKYMPKYAKWDHPTEHGFPESLSQMVTIFDQFSANDAELGLIALESMGKIYSTRKTTVIHADLNPGNVRCM